MISSYQSLLAEELKHLKNTFHKKNGYPLWIINQVWKQLKKPSTQKRFQQAKQIY